MKGDQLQAGRLPGIDRVRALLSYDAATGRLFWLAPRGVNVKAGQVAGTNHEGYVRIKVDGCLVFAHRLAWALSTGAWPSGEIDHIDGDKSNNRWANLRCVDRCVNMQNQRRAPASNQSCGLIGATWLKSKQRWAAQISVDGRKRHLGVFDTADQAHAAYVVAKRALHAGSTL